jgi:hypothetical protein
MPESSRPHTHTKLKNSERHLKEKTTTQVSLPYLTCKTSIDRAKPKPNQKKKKKTVSPNSYRKQINTQNTITNKASLQSLRKKRKTTQNPKLEGEQKEKIYQQSDSSLKKSLFVLFLFETNKQPTNALASKKERKKDR